MNGPTRRRWLVPAATLVLLVLGTAAVTLALASFADSDDPGSAPTKTESPSPAPAVPVVPDDSAGPPAGGPDDGPVAAMADPAWVTATAKAIGVPARALAAYAGASIAITTRHPSCGLGWNTLAAIGQVESDRKTIGPLHLVPAAWNAHATDGNGNGATDVHHIGDAALTAAVHLCHAGEDLTQPDGWAAAMTAYNPETDYSKRVARVASRFAEVAAGGT